VRFAKPLGRTREYVEIVRTALARERLRYDGEHWQLPLADGPGKALTLTVHPVRDQVPIYLAAVGPKNLELAGEVADGWLAVFFAPEHAEVSLAPLRTGLARAGKDAASFDIVPTVPVVLGDDPVAAADPVRAYAALYIGGMGSRQQNFYNQLAQRMGYGQAAAQVQDAYLDKRYDDAMAAVPADLIDKTSLLGSVERISDRLPAYAEAGVTTLTVALVPGPHDVGVATLRAMVDAVERAGLAE
jgi:F420-dependent oxidoreductase-like protein